jgi:hypothetical protein
MKVNLSNTVFGLIVVAIGAVLLLNNLGVTRIDVWYLVARYWPVTLILLGISSLTGDWGRSERDRDSEDSERRASRRRGQAIGGWILLLLGLVLLSGTAGWYTIHWARLSGMFWACVLIVAGWAILRWRPLDDASGADDGGYATTKWVFLSSLERRQPGWQLESGSYVVLLGGAELDLTRASIKAGTTYLDLTAMLGSIELRVPEDVMVYCNASALMGGVEFFDQSTGGVVSSQGFSRPGSAESGRVLEINCRAIMGSVELK